MFLFCYNNIYEVFDTPLYVSDLVDHPHQNAIVNLSVRAQRIRTIGDIYWDLLQEIGLQNFGAWLDKSKICREGSEKRQAGALDTSWSCSPPREFLLLQRILSSSHCIAHMIESGPPRLSRMISLTESQLAVGFNHIYKMPFKEHLN